MEFKHREYRVEFLIRDIKKKETQNGKLHLDFANQRPEGLWSREAQSLLIHSVLQRDIIPEVYITKDGKNEIKPHYVVDGKQRITTIFKFHENGFKLHKNTPNIKIIAPVYDENKRPVLNEEGKQVYKKQEFVIAGKAYKDLDDYVKDCFDSYDLFYREVFNYSESELTELMFKLNNGKAITSVQKAIARLNFTLAEEIEKIANNDFFEERICYTTGKIKASEGKKCVLNSLIIYTGKDYSKLNGSTMNKLASEFNDDWSQKSLVQLNNLFLLLNDLLPANNDLVKDHLTTNNIPILIMNVDYYCSKLENGEITEEQYEDFLKYWFAEGIYNEQYVENSGKSVSSKTCIDNRIKMMEDALDCFLQGKTLDDIYDIDTISINNKMYLVDDISVDDIANITGTETDNTADKNDISTDETESDIEYSVETINIENVINNANDNIDAANDNADLNEYFKLLYEAFDDNKQMALCSLMETIQNPYANDFTDDNINSFCDWFARLSYDTQEKVILNCIDIKEKLDNIVENKLSQETSLKNISLFIDGNIPILIGLYKNLNDQYDSDDSFDDFFGNWVYAFCMEDKTAYITVCDKTIEDYNDLSANEQKTTGVIVSKQTILNSSFNNYINSINTVCA